MKNIKRMLACAALVSSTVAFAGMNDDPEMSKIDTTPDTRDAPPSGIDEATLVEVIAKVTAVDMANRLVTIEGPEGNAVVMQVTDQVKNLPNVKIGDKVRIEYYRSAFAEIEKHDSGAELGTEMAAAKVTAAEGQKPAGAIGAVMVRRAEVVFVDQYQKFISFRSPDRGLRKISLKDRPELQHYLTELKKGDIVQVTYTEALAITLEPAE